MNGRHSFCSAALADEIRVRRFFALPLVLCICVSWTQSVKAQFLEDELKIKNREVLEWIDLTEQTFDFACYAHIWFEKGDDKAKRAILACLGSNLTLKGKKVFVNYHSFVKTLIKSRQAVEDELEKVRTSKVSSNKRQNPTNCEVSSLGLRTWDNVRKAIIEENMAFRAV